MKVLDLNEQWGIVFEGMSKIVGHLEWSICVAMYVWPDHNLLLIVIASNNSNE